MKKLNSSLFTTKLCDLADVFDHELYLEIIGTLKSLYGCAYNHLKTFGIDNNELNNLPDETINSLNSFNRFSRFNAYEIKASLNSLFFLRSLISGNNGEFKKRNVVTRILNSESIIPDFIDDSITFFGVLRLLSVFTSKEQVIFAVNELISNNECDYPLLGNAGKCKTTLNLLRTVLFDNDTYNVVDEKTIIYRRKMTKFIYQIEKQYGSLMDFINQIEDINLKNSLNLLKLWYENNKVLGDKVRGQIYTDEAIKEIYKKIISYAYRKDSELLQVLEDLNYIPVPHLDDVSSMFEYSIKLIDRASLDDIILRGFSESDIRHRKKKLDAYINDLNLENLDMFIGERISLTEAFHGKPRDGVILYFDLCTLVSEDTIKIGNIDTKFKSITLLNPFGFSFDNNVVLASINNIPAKGIFTKPEYIIGKRTICLDEIEAKDDIKSYTSYDFEYANSRNMTRKISSFGYSLWKGFEKIDMYETYINPEAKFVHDNEENENVEYIPDNIEEYLAAPTYPQMYDKIKGVLTSNNVLVGYGNISDAYAVMDSNRRYDMDNYNYSYVDVKDVYSYFARTYNQFSKKKRKYPEKCGLNTLIKHLNFSEEQVHEACDDSLKCFRALRTIAKLMKYTETDIYQLIELSNALYEVSDGKVYRLVDKERMEEKQPIYKDMLLPEIK